jgi:alanine dehydrogenase
MKVGTVREIMAQEYQVGGAVIVDVAVDQGGVANMPGAVALSLTQALTSTTLPYRFAIAADGRGAACRRSPALREGLNTHDGRCVYPGVAEACGPEYAPVEQALGVK